jgi:hypothetical protein
MGGHVSLMSDINTSKTSAMPEDKASAELQGVTYMTVPLSQLPKDEAVALIYRLFNREERFARSFYRYWAEVLNQPEEEAWKNTEEELQGYIDSLTTNLSDPYYHTIGSVENGHYEPVGLFGFRDLELHPTGAKLMQAIGHNPELATRYQGKLAIAHAMSMLDGHRHLQMLRYAFLLIGLEAMQRDIQHIFFFMSDHRLGRVYTRFGLDFPPSLRLPDTQHLVGSYSINDTTRAAILATEQELLHPVPRPE